MSKVLFDKKILKERGLVTNGFCLPYNPQLIPRANELGKKITPAEWKLWMGLFKSARKGLCPARNIVHI